MSESIPIETGQRQPVSQVEFLLWREVDRLDARITENRTMIERLDSLGSRGVGALQGKVEQFSKELQRLTDDLEGHEASHVSNKRWTVGIVIALVTPLYPLLGFILINLAKVAT